MPNTTYGSPYAQSSDLVSNWPGVSLNVADRLDDVSFKGNGLNDQTGTTYTLVLTDAGKTVTLNNASAVTVTIPTNASVAYETGSCIYFTNKGAGVVTISPAGGVTLNNSSTLAQNASGYIQKLDTNTWVMVSGGGAGMTTISSGTLSGGSVVLSSIPGTYKDLRLVVRNYLPATDSIGHQLRFNGDSSTRYRVLTTGAASQTFNGTVMNPGYAQDNAVTQALLIGEIFDYANTTTWKLCRFTSINNDATTTTNVGLDIMWGIYNQTPAITSITIFPSSGNFTSGNYLLYGMG